MKDKTKGQSTQETRQREQGIPEADRTAGRQQGGFPHEDGGWGQTQHEQGGQSSGQHGERKGDHHQGGENNEQSRHTDKGKGL
jgi:hypothetical protein